MEFARKKKSQPAQTPNSTTSSASITPSASKPLKQSTKKVSMSGTHAQVQLSLQSQRFGGLFGTRSKPGTSSSSTEPSTSTAALAQPSSNAQEAVVVLPCPAEGETESASIFQGENRIFPSRQSAANLEQQSGKISCAQSNDLEQFVANNTTSLTVKPPKQSVSMPSFDVIPPANIQATSSFQRRTTDGSQSKTNSQDQEEVHVVPVANSGSVELLDSRGESMDRMGDDGYPIVLGEFGPSDRQNLLSRQRHIDDVIEQQLDDDFILQNRLENMNLERDNINRIFHDDDYEDEDDYGEDVTHPQLRVDLPQFQVAGSSTSANRVGTLASSSNAGPSASTMFAAMERNLAANLTVSNSGRPRLQIADVGESSSSSPLPRAVNILPASRSLIEHPVSNLIAIGRRPPNPLASASEFQQLNLRYRAANSIGDCSPLGWQAAKSTLKERISFMYSNDILADVYFIVGKNDGRQRIPAHKFVLSIGSVVFDAMFNGGLTPQNSRDPLEIELPDVEPSAFLTLLKFLYSDEVNIGPESVMTTLYTAKKYAVPAMETACVEFLKQSLGADNSFMLLTQARLFDEPQLEQLCLELIDKNTIEALNGEGFTEIDLDTLCTVLRRDALRIREAPLFQAVVRWASEECGRRGMPVTPENKRAVLGPAMQLIRFPLMTVEEFAQVAAQTSLLSDRELVNLFMYFTVNPKPQVSYSDRPRSAISGKEALVSRFQRTENRWGYCGTSDRIKFTVDRRIYVVGFGLYGSVLGPCEYQVQIKIIHCGTGKTLAENDTSFLCDGTPTPNRVCFREPVEISPSITYIASALLKGPDSFYGTKGLRRIVHQASEVTFQFTYAAMNNNGTSVEDGQIPEIVFYTAKM